MPTDRAWTIKGVRDDTRKATRQAARAAGLSIGTWVDRALSEVAHRELNPPPQQQPEPPPPPQGPPQGEMPQVVREAPAGDRPSPIEAMRARMRRRRRSA